MQINGTISKFHVRRSSGWAVTTFKCTDGSAITAVGNLLDYKEGEPVVLYGEWEVYKDVNQFKAASSCWDQPKDLKGLEGFLASAVCGCGPVKAKAMVKKHGLSLFDYLKTRDIEKLCQTKGIGPATAARIADDFNEKQREYNVGVFLNSIGMANTRSKTILRDLGPDAVRIIQKNPYSLTNVHGIGFKVADVIALKMGWKIDSPERARAGILHLLNEATSSGHCYLPRAEVLHNAIDTGSKGLGMDPKLSETAIDDCYEQKMLIKETASLSGTPCELVYLPALYQAEVRLARKLRSLLSIKPTCRYLPEQMDWLVHESEKAVGIELTAEQHAAVLRVFTEPISILTGGPGTGKTACQLVVVDVARRLSYSMALCAPTGRAAKHLSNVVKEQAQTIHMLLKYSSEDNRWNKNENDPLDAGLVIVDEFSMVDVDLALRIFEAVKPGTPVLIIGDKDQLPAVSPGKVLEDLIASEAIPVTRLTKIFRQAEQSLIVRNAYRILNGNMPEFPAKAATEGEMLDCYLMEPPSVPALDEKGKQKKTKGNRPATTESPEWITRNLLRLCKERIPLRMNVDPIRDIQILTPMKERGLGVYALNTILQDALNPRPEGTPEGEGPSEVIIGSKRFRTGDRVQQHRNNYTLREQTKGPDDIEGEVTGGVSNGDIGFVTDILPDEKLLVISFYGRVILYPFKETDDLHLGYAMTIHKSQGGEFPVVIIVLFSANYVMLERNLLYTADTRAQKLLVFIAQKHVIRRAVENANTRARNSLLRPRLLKELAADRKKVA